MKKALALLLLLSSSAVFTGEVSTLTTISGSSLLAPKSLGTISVLHANDGFKVLQNGKKHGVQRCLTDKALRGRTPQQIAAFLAAGGKLSVKKIDKQFKLTANTPGLGGGPVAGLIAYGVTKALGYATAAVTIVVAPAAIAAGPVAVPAVVAATETAAVSVGSFFVAIPFLP